MQRNVDVPTMGRDAKGEWEGVSKTTRRERWRWRTEGKEANERQGSVETNFAVFYGHISQRSFNLILRERLGDPIRSWRSLLSPYRLLPQI
jgi:hypothetical protein